MTIKGIILKYESTLSYLYRLFDLTSVRKSGFYNKVDVRAFMKKSAITINGNNNTIEIEGGVNRIRNYKFIIRGNDCVIHIKRSCVLQNSCLLIEDDKGSIYIGNNTIFAGSVHAAATEGRTIRIGDSCLFSSNIQIRTGDSHAIYDLMNNKRINTALDVTISNHVWIGQNVTILKGSNIGNNNVVGTGAIVTNKVPVDNCILGGIGGKVLKQNINWQEER